MSAVQAEVLVITSHYCTVISRERRRVQYSQWDGEKSEKERKKGTKKNPLWLLCIYWIWSAIAMNDSQWIIIIDIERTENKFRNKGIRLMLNMLLQCCVYMWPLRVPMTLDYYWLLDYFGGLVVGCAVVKNAKKTTRPCRNQILLCISYIDIDPAAALERPRVVVGCGLLIGQLFMLLCFVCAFVYLFIGGKRHRTVS